MEVIIQLLVQIKPSLNASKPLSHGFRHISPPYQVAFSVDGLNFLDLVLILFLDFGYIFNS